MQACIRQSVALSLIVVMALGCDVGRTTIPSATPTGTPTGSAPASATATNAVVPVAATVSPTASRGDQPADVPSFRGGPARTGVMPGPAPSRTPTLLWRHATGVIGVPPAVKDGIVYAGDASGQMYAWDLAMGAELWPAPTSQLGGAAWAITVDGELLFVATSDHRVHAIDRLTFRERWSFVGTTEKDIPVVVGDEVYVGVDGAVVALDRSSGVERWRVAVRGQAAYTAYADGVLYVTDFGDDGGVNAIDVREHRLRWRFETHASNVLAPAVDGLTVFAAAQDAPGRNAALFAIDAASGTQRWRFQAPDAADLGNLAVGDRFIYVSAFEPTNLILAVERDTGALAWQAPTPGSVSRLSIAGDSLFGTAHDQLLVLDLTTGASRGPIDIVGYGGGTTITGGVILVPCCYDSEAPGSMAAYVAPDDPRLAVVLAARTPEPSATPRPALATLVRSFGFDDKPSLWLSLAVAPSGNLFVADMENDRVIEFGPDGTPIASHGSTGTGPGQFNFDEVTSFDASTGIAIAADGTIAVGDGANHRVQLFDPQFRFIRAWGSLGRGPGQFVNACCPGWAPSGELLVADPGRNDIQVFSRAGKLIRTIGRSGTKPGDFYRLGAPVTDAAGNIYVPDFSNRRIEKFTADGTYLASYGNDPGKGPIIAEANSVFVDGAGRMWIGDGAGRIVVLDPDGRVLAVDDPWTIDGVVYPGISGLGPDSLIYLVDPGEGKPAHVAILRVNPAVIPPA